MSNIFSQFLSGFAGGIFDKSGYLRDFQHASRLYVDSNYNMAPKAGWSYFIEIGLNPSLPAIAVDTLDQKWYLREKGKFGLVAKAVELPRFTINTETLVAYNKKEVIQTKINYNPITITFHDDMGNMINNLWKNYYQYYYADGRYDGSAQGKLMSRTMTNPAAYSKATQGGGGNPYLGYQYGLNNGQSEPFISFINIFLLNKRTYNSITLVNPLITEWNHSGLDNSVTRMLENKMTVAYEAVYYDLFANPVTKIQPGFNEIHYDNTPSPLSSFGRGGKGIGGLLSGATDVLGILGQEGPLSFGDVVSLAVGTKNLVDNYKSVKQQGWKQATKEYGYSILTSTFSDAAKGKNSFADTNIVQDVKNTPVSLNLFKSSGSNTSGATATEKTGLK